MKVYPPLKNFQKQEATFGAVYLLSQCCHASVLTETEIRREIYHARLFGRLNQISARNHTPILC